MVCSFTSFRSLAQMVPPLKAFLPPTPSTHSLYPPTCFSAVRLCILPFMCGPVCCPPSPQEGKLQESKVLCPDPCLNPSTRQVGGPQQTIKRLNELQPKQTVNISNKQRKYPDSRDRKDTMVSSSWCISSHKYNTPGPTLRLTNPQAYWFTLSNSYRNSSGIQQRGSPWWTI